MSNSSPINHQATGIQYGTVTGKAIAKATTDFQHGALAASQFLRGFVLGFKQACTKPQ